jgi:hypothetical protein
MAVNFGDNFNIGAFKPIDLRLVVDAPIDLTLIQYPYKGMLVSVKNDTGFVRTYRLKADFATPLTNWEVIGQAASLASLPDVSILNAKNGDVLVYGTAGTAGSGLKWLNRGPFVERVTAGTSGDLLFVFSDGTSTTIQIAGGSLENNQYNSNNFIIDGASYNSSLSTIDEILGAIAPTRAADLTATSLVLSNTTQYSAKVSSGLLPQWLPVAGTTITNYIVDGTYILTSPNQATSFNAGQFSNPASYGILSHVRNGSAFVTRNLNLLNGTTNTTDADGSSNLNVTSVAVYNSIWAKANANISYTQNNADEGTITHAMSSTVAGVSNTTALNFDHINTAPTFLSLPIYVDQNATVTKYLSGIAHYGINSTIDMDFTANSGIFNRCYHPTAVATVTGSAITSFNMNPIGTPNYLDQFSPGTQTITLNVANIATGASNGSLTVTLQKPSGLNTPTTQPYAILDSISGRVNTYGTISTTKAELFLDEANRLIINTNTPFNSTVALANGDAQVRNGSLTYGNIDYTKTGDQQYERIFTVSPQQNGGSMTFAGFTASNIAPYNTGNINMFLILTTNGLYYDLGRPFGINNGSGDGSSLANSIGAQVSTSTGLLNYTFGVNSTFPTNQFRMIIIFKNNTYTITSITIT